MSLLAALEVATGQITARFTGKKKRIEFLEFMDQIVMDYSQEHEIHVTLDNYRIHKRRDVWLAAHPDFSFNYTPESASWLNMVEIWFAIMTRKALKGANFKRMDELSKDIKDFISFCNDNVEPLAWRKLEAKGSQLKNTIVNLCKQTLETTSKCP